MMINFCGFSLVPLLTTLFTNPMNVLQLFDLGVSFRMYETGNQSDYTPFDLSTLQAQNFNKSKQYVILTNGWLAGFNVNWYGETIPAFASYENVVVIAAGYEPAMSCLFGGMLNTVAVGKIMGEMLLGLHSKEIPIENIQLVGHSFGAHIAGISGQAVYDKTKIKIPRLFGLDPAVIFIRPLNKGDAKDVIVIHTSLLGIQFDIGDVDFFPNGGKKQAGQCQYLNYSDHEMATYYFFSSVDETCDNVGLKCPNYIAFGLDLCDDNDEALMGYNIADTAEGDYYLDVQC